MTYEGLGLTGEERDFLIDGYALSLQVNSLQFAKKNRQAKAAIKAIDKFNEKHQHLSDSIQDKIQLYIRENTAN